MKKILLNNEKWMLRSITDPQLKALISLLMTLTDSSDRRKVKNEIKKRIDLIT
jgi:hypothetical protein